MKVKLHRFFAIFWGFGFTIGWIYYILTDQLPELETTPYQARVDLLAEFILSVGLIFIGFLMRSDKSTSVINVYRVWLGMFWFSAITSVGFFIEVMWLSATIQWIAISAWAAWAIIDTVK